MHEENFWSNWLREDERGKEERTAEVVRWRAVRRRGGHLDGCRPWLASTAQPLEGGSDGSGAMNA